MGIAKLLVSVTWANDNLCYQANKRPVDVDQKINASNKRSLKSNRLGDILSGHDHILAKHLSIQNSVWRMVLRM